VAAAFASTAQHRQIDHPLGIAQFDDVIEGARSRKVSAAKCKGQQQDDANDQLVNDRRKKQTPPWHIAMTDIGKSKCGASDSARINRMSETSMGFQHQRWWRHPELDP